MSMRDERSFERFCDRLSDGASVGSRMGAGRNDGVSSPLMDDITLKKATSDQSPNVT